jgi:NADH-quinone oxidoreductase subunit E
MPIYYNSQDFLGEDALMSFAPVYAQSQIEQQDFVDGVIAKYQGKPGKLLSILEEVQENHPQKYLPMEVLEYIAARTNIPTAQIYSVATFYALFNLQPQGTNTVCICRGTACHTRGSRNLLERSKLELGLKEGEEEGSADKVSMTSPDGKYTVRTVACFGQCALAPVVEINHSILGHVNEQALHRELQALDPDRRRRT